MKADSRASLAQGRRRFVATLLATSCCAIPGAGAQDRRGAQDRGQAQDRGATQDREANRERGAAQSPLRIGIIGAGNIGGTLAELWVGAGHRVMLSSRHPEQLKGLAARLGPLASVGTPAEAAAFGDAVLVAIPYGSYPQLGKSLDGALEGKVVLDAGNPGSSRGPELADEARAEGIGPTSRKYLGNPRLVRAFSNLSSRVLAREANRPPPRLAMPILGDDREALELASRLVADAGFDPVVIGSLERAPETAMGGSLSGVQATAAELRQRLRLPDDTRSTQ